MAPTTQHSRSHALLLFQKLLNLRDSASPLTLILDTLEQSANPIIREFVARARISKSKIIFVSFATLKKPADVDIFVKARAKPPKPCTPRSSRIIRLDRRDIPAVQVLLIFDALNPLCTAIPSQMPQVLSSLITGPTVSLVATYHTDVPLALSPQSTLGEYEPHPLTVLSHLATAILRTSNLGQAAERKRARDRSLVEPEFGLREGREGVLVGLQQTREKDVEGALVVEMEIRRRSGRSVAEKFVLVSPPTPGGGGAPLSAAKSKVDTGARISLLSDHPLLRDVHEPAAEEGGEDAETTFSLGLTEKQRKDREGIVLPYFDAQTDIGAGEGGRILYEMGREDDFDDEEDEI
ncbi:Elongator complex protein 5 [Apiospora phragmitis]|uniref:Elongator complex protein 5 n=1 Tax=Apiospora phragmitis TaxID=2905665 RepID=A0ABR1UHJ0_9PEZI